MVSPRGGTKEKKGLPSFQYQFCPLPVNSFKVPMERPVQRPSTHLYRIIDCPTSWQRLTMEYTGPLYLWDQSSDQTIKQPSFQLRSTIDEWNMGPFMSAKTITEFKHFWSYRITLCQSCLSGRNWRSSPRTWRPKWPSDEYSCNLLDCSCWNFKAGKNHGTHLFGLTNFRKFPLFSSIFSVFYLMN